MYKYPFLISIIINLSITYIYAADSIPKDMGGDALTKITNVIKREVIVVDGSLYYRSVGLSNRDGYDHFVPFLDNDYRDLRSKDPGRIERVLKKFGQYDELNQLRARRLRTLLPPLIIDQVTAAIRAVNIPDGTLLAHYIESNILQIQRLESQITDIQMRVRFDPRINHPGNQQVAAQLTQDIINLKKDIIRIANESKDVIQRGQLQPEIKAILNTSIDRIAGRTIKNESLMNLAPEISPMEKIARNEPEKILPLESAQPKNPPPKGIRRWFNKFFGGSGGTKAVGGMLQIAPDIISITTDAELITQYVRLKKLLTNLEQAQKEEYQLILSSQEKKLLKNKNMILTEINKIEERDSEVFGHMLRQVEFGEMSPKQQEEAFKNFRELRELGIF